MTNPSIALFLRFRLTYMWCDKFDFISVKPSPMTYHGWIENQPFPNFCLWNPRNISLFFGEIDSLSLLNLPQFTNDIPMNPNQQSFSMVNHYHFPNVLMLKSPICSWFCHDFRSIFWDISHDISHEIPVFHGESPRKITKSPLGSPNPPWRDWSPVEMAIDYRLRRSQHGFHGFAIDICYNTLLDMDYSPIIWFSFQDLLQPGTHRTKI